MLAHTQLTVLDYLLVCIVWVLLATSFDAARRKLTSTDQSVKEHQPRCMRPWLRQPTARTSPLSRPTTMDGVGQEDARKMGQRNGNCGNDDDVWQTDKGVVDCCVARVPTWGTSLPPSFFLLLPSTRSGKPHKPITNLITCAQLCPQCGDLRPDQVLLSSALAACFMCLVQHVPRRVAAFGSCVSV